MTEKEAAKKSLTVQELHQKKLNRRAQQYIIIGLVLILITILAFTRVTSQILAKLPFPGKPAYQSSIYGSQDKIILNRPIGVAVSNDKGDIYTVDMGNHRIVVFNNTGRLLFTFGEKKLKVPVYIALDSQDNVYVSDRVLEKVLVFDKDGVFYTEIKNKKIKNPLGLATDSKDNLYIGDVGGDHRIHVVDKFGELVASFGHKRQVAMPTLDKGFFYFPNGITVDADGNIYVADSNNKRVQIFDKYYAPQTVFNVGGLPRGVAYNATSSYIYVVNTISHDIGVYNVSGKLVNTFSKQGRGNEDFMYPSGIAMDKEGHIYISDRNNGRIQVFDTKITPSTLSNALLPYAPLVVFPWLFLLMGLALTKKKRYIPSSCFIKEIKLSDHKVFTENVKNLYLTEGCHEELKKEILYEQIKEKTKTKAHDKVFAEKIRDEYKLTHNQAEALALAHKKGLFRPILLADKKNVIEAAKSLGIEVTTYKEFFDKKKKKKGAKN